MRVTKRQKIKLVLTSLLSLLSVILFALSPSFTKLICVFAMLTSSLGDIIMMDLKSLTRHIKGDIFIAGMLSFGVAHIMYIILYITKASVLECRINIGTLIAIGITLGTILLLIVFCMVKKNLPISFIFIGITYIMILSINLCSISTIAFSVGGPAYLTLFGAASFFASDMIIAFNKVQNSSHGEIPIWIFYVMGQLFLILGA